MAIKRLLPLASKRNHLSPEAQGVVNTLAQYGYGKGVILGAGRLGSVISNEGDAALIINELTGKMPALFEWDYLDPVMYPGKEAKVASDMAGMNARMKEHWEAGGIVGMHIAWRNFRTANTSYSGDWYDRRRDRPEDVSDLLTDAEDSYAKEAYWTFIDTMCDYLNTECIDSKGRKIPQILRLFSENNAWYDYIKGEGYYPDDMEDRYIESIVKQTSGKYRITFKQRPTTGHSPSIPLYGPVLQVTGCSNEAWNSRYDNLVPVSGTDAVGDTFVVEGWKGEQQPTGSAPTGPDLRAYPATGFWWAGRDRCEALMQLVRETLDYIRVTKGCTHVIHAVSNFPSNGSSSPWSAYEARVDVEGRTFDYVNWHPGWEYVDVGGIDYYSSNSLTEDLLWPRLIESSAKHRSINGFKPWLIHELGFGNDTSKSGPGHQLKGFWMDKFLPQLIRNYHYCAGFTFWSHYFFPDKSHPAFESFNEMVHNENIITLDKLNRLV